MRTVRVNASTPYDILIGKGLLDSCGRLCAEVLKPCRLCIVTDDTVASLYLERAEKALSAAGFETVHFIFPHGEQSKNIRTLSDILEFLAESRLTRTDALVALGGGVVGDMCGFAAAVYLRGIKFVQIPTTLLSAVDSSVGGKTGIDLRAGKNLAGCFHQPSLVICDYSTLDTLPTETFADGCAEVIKYGVINDKPFFDRLFGGIKEQLEDVIAECVSNKSKIVETDEREGGCRRLLNLGHTVGHAIELCSELKISHGSAVAIGTVTVMRSAVKQGLCPSAALSSLLSLLKKEGLPTSCEFSAEQLADIAATDKKRSGNSITLAVPYDIGDTRLVTLPLDKLCDFIKEGL